jgi:hypothetical protein
MIEIKKIIKIYGKDDGDEREDDGDLVLPPPIGFGFRLGGSLDN